MQAPDKTWTQLDKDKAAMLLATEHGLQRRPPKGGIVSETDIVLGDAMQNRRLDFSVRALAGYRAGIQEMPDGTTFMVQRSSHWNEPVEGTWKSIERFLKEMFGPVPVIDDQKVVIHPGYDQYPYILGNLSIWVRDYYGEYFGPRPAIALLGPRKCGKNLLQEVIITWLLGGSCADPTQYLTSTTSFNSDFFGCTHLMIADSLNASDHKSQGVLESAIKNISANNFQRLHPKGVEALNQILLFWRLTISANDDGPGIGVLPRPDGSMADKMQLFKVVRPESMPHTDQEMEWYVNRLKEELPAFLFYLLNRHNIPQELRTDRSGIIPWQHPDLVRERVGESNEAIVADHLYRHYFMGKQQDRSKQAQSFTAAASGIFTALMGIEGIKDSLNRLKIDEKKFPRILTSLAERPLDIARVDVKKVHTKHGNAYQITERKEPEADPTASGISGQTDPLFEELLKKNPQPAQPEKDPVTETFGFSDWTPEKRAEIEKLKALYTQLDKNKSHANT